MSDTGTRTAVATAIAMLAFAANSLLCRLALGQGLIDAASFTSIRVIAGAAVLALMLRPNWGRTGAGTVDWPSTTMSTAMLFTYMACFSFAYLSLSAGTGALLLFGAVQLTMLIAALREGERFSLFSWAGVASAAFGLVYLVLPGLEAPDPAGALLMTVAGVAWGGYSLAGRRTKEPLRATAYSFICSVPLAVLASLLFSADYTFSPAGLLFAIASGALASGLGYVVWYSAIKALSAGQAAIVQLSVPVIAAFGGAVLLSETITLRLLVASIATLGGIALVLSQRARGLPSIS